MLIIDGFTPYDVAEFIDPGGDSTPLIPPNTDPCPLSMLPILLKLLRGSELKDGIDRSDGTDLREGMDLRSGIAPVPADASAWFWCAAAAALARSNS